VPAITAPHAGTSYNPTADAHTKLILAAGEECVKEMVEAEKYDGVKEQADDARKFRQENDGQELIMGMKVDIPGDDVEEEEGGGGEESVPAKKLTVRKTKQQRKKALQQKAEVRR
jgi:nucleolar protein 53